MSIIGAIEEQNVVPKKMSEKKFTSLQDTYFYLLTKIVPSILVENLKSIQMRTFMY